MARKYHMSQSLTGALRNWDGRAWEDATEWMRKDDGTKFRSGEELEHHVQLMVDEGIECIAFGKCDNFDPKRGCLGHETQMPEARS